MAAVRGAPWDDWWDNLASQGHWTLPASQARRATKAETQGALPAPSRLTEASQPPAQVSISWREIEELHTAVSQLDGEKRRLQADLELAVKGLQESTALRASLELLEDENLSLRQRLILLERGRR